MSLINPDILSLKHILLFGVKGVAAYADHAQILGQEDEKIYAFIHEALATTLSKNLDLERLDRSGFKMRRNQSAHHGTPG